MARDGYQDGLSRDAMVSGRGAYPESDGSEFGPDVAGSRLLVAAQWLALAAAIVTVAAACIAAAAVVSSRNSDQPQQFSGLSSMARGSGALIAIGGVFVAVFFAVLLYGVAQGLFAHPRGGAIVFFAVAGIVAAIAAALLLAPDLVFGDAGNAAARSASSLPSDAKIAVLALLAAAALAALAGAVAVVATIRRDRAATVRVRPE